ncbi:MAG: DUF1727 domain-containing protein [Eubacterium sp.]|nr:DUF1727 domain-containing protein [Eubacterium sp.]
MVFLTILIAKLISKLLRFMKKGATSFPGKVALYMKYDILNTLSKGVDIICVTGTNGKTTTCAMLEYALRTAGKTCFVNKSGANMISGVASAFIENSSLFGRCKKEYAILECDENSFPEISRYLDSKVVAITNIFRDQLDRYGETDSALLSIENAIKNMPFATLVLNADCPMTYSLSENSSNDVLTFGINENLNLATADSIAFCPICKSELIYKSRVYARLGNYFCPRCAYKRVYPDVFIEDISFSSEGGYEFFITSNGKKELSSLSLGGIYNIYNYCCAKAVLSALNINENGALSAFSGAFGRLEKFKNNSNEVLLMLVKNPVGYANCINYVSKMKKDINIVFALNDNDADGRDISWIWDVSFSKLNFSKVFAYGRRAFDMALRLKYDGFSDVQTIDGENNSQLINLIKNSGEDFIVFANYTAMMNLRKHFIKSFGGKEFWE